MYKRTWQYGCLAASLVAGPALSTGRAQNNLPEHPVVTVQGKSYTPRSVLSRNRGADEEDQYREFPAHKIIGNVYYVGTKTLSTYLVVTPAGNILIDSGYERNIPLVKKGVEKLGFKFTDIKLVLNNHEHSDHVEGDAMVKEMTAARVVEIAEGVTGLKAVKPGGKEHPIDQVVHDGESVTLGGVTLTAHLAPGHAHGGTAWTMKATEGGKTYDVDFFPSVRASGKMTPELIAEYTRSFLLLRALPCDVPLADHTETYNIQEKYAKIKPGAPNPYIDPGGCNVETDVQDSMFHALLEEQAQAPK